MSDLLLFGGGGGGGWGGGGEGGEGGGREIDGGLVCGVSVGGGKVSIYCMVGGGAGGGMAPHQPYLLSMISLIHSLQCRTELVSLFALPRSRP